MPSAYRRALAILGLCVSVAACTKHETATARRAASPLIGTWTRQGNAPSAAGRNLPEFTKLAFAADGTLQATYVSAGIGTLTGSAAAEKSESDTYRLSGDSKLSIAEGTRHLEYTYRVDGSTLYLTPEGASEAAQFEKGG